MKIQINTDHNIEGREALTEHLTDLIEGGLGRVSEHITRVEVHLSDENGGKHGKDDKRCMMEARLEGHQPIAVTHHAPSLHQAVAGATDKLTRSIESTQGRAGEKKRHGTESRLAAPEPEDAQ